MNLFRSKELIAEVTSKDSSAIEIKDELLSKLQHTELEMLKDINSVCQNNNIDIFLGGGTLLGAIRHKGFIPWDDDIDLNIQRKNVDKLIGVINRNFSCKYNVIFKDNQSFPYLRIEKKNTIFDELINLDRNRGIKIDVFIIEDLPESNLIMFVYGIICTIKLFIASSEVFYENKNPKFIEIMTNNSKSKANYYFRRFIGLIFSHPRYKERIKNNDKYFSKYEGSNSKYVSIMNGRRHYFGEMYPRKMFEDIIEVEFEGVKCKIQRDYDLYLKNLYGDNYMELPPIEKREHHYVYNLKF